MSMWYKMYFPANGDHSAYIGLNIQQIDRANDIYDSLDKTRSKEVYKRYMDLFWLKTRWSFDFEKRAKFAAIKRVLYDKMMEDGSWEEERQAYIAKRREELENRHPLVKAAVKAISYLDPLTWFGYGNYNLEHLTDE